MQTFNYTARDTNTGSKVKNQVQAVSERAAAQLLIEKGLSPIEIKPERESGLFGLGSKKIKTKDRIIFARQLSTLINAGLPLVQSLRSTLDQTTNAPMRVLISEIIADIESGIPFSDALAKHPKVFSTIFVSLVAAGEASGTLDTSLERLALQQEKDAEILSKVRGAMVYPMIVVLVMFGVVSFMIVAVLPQVAQLYEGQDGVNLPFITQALLNLSNFARGPGGIVLVAGFIAAVVFLRQYIRTTRGKTQFDKAKMRVPPFGQLFMKLYMARFARTASTLVASGVPLLQVLEIVSESIGNTIVGGSIKQAIAKVKGGKSLADAIEGDPSFLSLVPNMLRVGEQSGSIEQMLGRTADYYEKEVDNQIKTVSTIIEPVLMVILGIVSITIVGAILLPIYSLVGQNVLR
ncbi:MAG: type II secretion system F family protein [Patescibacteria group bacterium]